MTQVTIHNATCTDYPALLEVWEASVRATHHFLAEGDLLLLACERI